MHTADLHFATTVLADRRAHLGSLRRGRRAREDRERRAPAPVRLSAGRPVVDRRLATR